MTLPSKENLFLIHDLTENTLSTTTKATLTLHKNWEEPAPTSLFISTHRLCGRNFDIFPDHNAVVCECKHFESQDKAQNSVSFSPSTLPVHRLAASFATTVSPFICCITSGSHSRYFSSSATNFWRSSVLCRKSSSISVRLSWIGSEPVAVFHFQLLGRKKQQAFLPQGRRRPRGAIPPKWKCRALFSWEN